MDFAAQAQQLARCCGNGDKGPLKKLALELGFAEGEKTAANLELLFEQYADGERLYALCRDALQSADPDQALNNLERLFGTAPREALLGVLDQPTERRLLLTVLGGSAFLTAILCRAPEYFSYLFSERAIDRRLDGAAMHALLREKIPDSADFATLQAGLRRFKACQILRIGSRDLGGLADLVEVTAELSELAASCLQRAFEICDRQLRAEHGAPLLAAPGESCPLEAEFTILGMGKLGGRELNFSSDIDLIYFYTSEHGATAGVDDGRGGRRGSIALPPYFCKLAELVTRALSEVTADGFVFRVDLNLRPEGSRGDLATSLRSAEVYYENWGQSWERSALLKARPVAGSLALGEQLLKSLEPFIYRRYLDYGMVEDIKLMKQKIDRSLSREREGELNLKLGRGGIREIEFFIQTLQLIFAGKEPQLRIKSSLQALAALHRAGHLQTPEFELLTAAYSFLRTAEHRIQVVQERQTHNLPSRPEQLRALARRCGFAGTAEFQAELKRHRDGVAGIFHDLFYTSEEEIKEELRPEVSFMFDDSADVDLVKDLLEEKGFKNPDAAFESLQILRHGPVRKPMSQRAHRELEKIAPLLMQAVIDSPEPDMALTNLEQFLVAMRARATFFALLAENREIIKLLISLFATSQFLSRIFIQSPEILDSLVSRGYAVTRKEPQEFHRDLEQQMSRVDTYEDRLEVLRRFRKEEFLRIALNDIYGHTPQGSTAFQLSSVADVCLNKAVALARQELIPRFGLPMVDPEVGDRHEAGFAILALGKLGGRELNYHSDLDIIFIFEGEGTTAPAAGTDPARFRGQSNQEYFARLAQRIISVLTLITREGYVYQIDTRLRPSGNQGPLVTSLSAFERYHAESAQLWERQALTKARVVTGPPQLAARIADLVEQIVFLRPLPDHLRSEIRRLRGRMEQEIAREDAEHFNIKTGRGGMVDVEFIAQYLQLLHGGEHPELRLGNTLEILYRLQKLELLKPAEYEVLGKGYKFLRRLENRLRLVHDQSINELSGEQQYLVKLARRLGYPDRPKRPEVAFLEEYRRVTEQIRAVFQAYLGETA